MDVSDLKSMKNVHVTGEREFRNTTEERENLTSENEGFIKQKLSHEDF